MHQNDRELFIPAAQGRIEIPRCRVCKTHINYMADVFPAERHCILCSRSICNQRLQASMELSEAAAKNLAGQATASYLITVLRMGAAMSAGDEASIKRLRKTLARCHERLERRLYLVGLVRVCDSTPIN